jgi:hypothetical protein
MSINFNFWRFATAIFCFGFLFSCDNEENNSPFIEEPTIKTKGFVIVGTTSSGTALAKYVDSLPAVGGAINLSADATDYPRFFPNAIYDHAIYLPNPDETVGGFSKYVVNNEGKLEEEGVIPTNDPTSFRIAVRDEQVGVFHDRATPNRITVFNPSTFEITNTIDMSAAPVPGDVDQRYQNFIFRGDDVFAPIRGNANELFPSFILHQVSLSTNQYVGSTQRDGNGVSSIVTFNKFGQSNIDDQGNLYIVDAGNYDGAGIPAAINKIAAGTNVIDTNYQFFPARVLNPANSFLPSANSLYLTTGTKAIAKVNAETPQAAIDIVVNAGGVQNLSPEEVQQVLGILFTASSARWCEIDLGAETVTPIEGIPSVGLFSGGIPFFNDGKVYLPVALTQDAGDYYSFDYTSGEVVKAFGVTGAELSGMYNLAVNN